MTIDGEDTAMTSELTGGPAGDVVGELAAGDVTGDLRYDEAAALAMTHEARGGTGLVVLRSAGSGPAVAGEGSDTGGRYGALDRLRFAELDPEELLAVAAGAAFGGLRPVIEVSATGDVPAVDFAALAGGLVEWPLPPLGGTTPLLLRVVAGPTAPGRPDPGIQALTAFAAVPGVGFAAPADPVSCYSAFLAALRHDGPVVVLERASLADGRAELMPATEPLAPGRARVVRSGEQMTVVAAQQLLKAALEAAGRLAEESGIELEVLDPCWLIPFDDAAVAGSLERTAKLLVVHDAPLAAGWAGALVARLVAGHLDLFDAPPRLLGPDEVGGSLPRSGDVVAAAAELAAY